MLIPNIKYNYFSQSVQSVFVQQVVLGRATNDVHVDIDLGKEGEEVATKISRRQVSFWCKISLHA